MSDQYPNHAQLPPPSNQPGTALAIAQPYMLQTQVGSAGEDDSADDALTLADLLRIVYKHKWTLVLVVLFSMIVAGVNTLLSRPTYRATTVLQIERPVRVVEFANSNTVDSEQQMGFDDAASLKTQYELMRSRSLAERVIDDMRLDQSKAPVAAPGSTEAGAPQPKPPTAQYTGVGTLDNYLERLLSGYRKLSAPSSSDQEVLGREGVVSAFLGALTVDPVPNSRLVRLSVDNSDPALAARIANATAQTFIAIGQERRGDTSAYAKTYLEEQIQVIKVKLEESERRLNRFAQAKQILTLDDKTNVVSQTYTDYAGALSKAEQDRIKAESLYNEVRRNPESAMLALESKTLQTYKEQKAKLETEYQQNLRIYKPDFPKMQQIKAQIGEVEAQIKGEIATVAKALQAQFEAAKRQEDQLREKVGQTRQQILTIQDHSIDLNLLKREVDTNRQLYDGLLQRLKQTGVTSGVTSKLISVVDPAVSPLFPYKPDLRANLLAGLAVGLFLGLCLVFLLEYLDDSIKKPDEVERVLGVPLMGIIPTDRRKKVESESIAMDVHADPRSTMAEAYRSLRTALQFSTSHGAPKELFITSTTRNEGKSTTSLALAINFAQMGQNVLLIDGDMRNPTVHKLMGIPNDRGLSNLLSSEGLGETLIQPTVVPNLSVLTAGPMPPNPVDLLIGMKLLSLLEKAHEVGFQHVIIDGPPVLGIADAIVLGNQVRNILFVVRASATRKGIIKTALRRLRLAGLAPRGVVLTQLSRQAMPEDYTSYYGYGSKTAAASHGMKNQTT